MNRLQIYQAIRRNDLPALQDLLRGHTQDDINRALYFACFHGSFNITQYLIDAKANVNYRDVNRWSCLNAAAKANSLQICRLLIEHQANVNAQCVQLYTPLHIAVRNSNSEILKLLIDNGADRTLQNEEGTTAGMYNNEAGRIARTRGIEWTPNNHIARTDTNEKESILNLMTFVRLNDSSLSLLPLEILYLIFNLLLK